MGKFQTLQSFWQKHPNLSLSVVLHLFFLILFLFGLPILNTRDYSTPPPPLDIELISPDQVPTKKSPPALAANKEELAKPKPIETAPPTPSLPPEPLIEPEKPKINDKIPTPAPKPDAKPEPAPKKPEPKPEPAPKPDVKPEPAPKPEAKPEPTPKPEAKPEPKKEEPKKSPEPPKETPTPPQRQDPKPIAENPPEKQSINQITSILKTLDKLKTTPDSAGKALENKALKAEDKASKIVDDVQKGDKDRMVATEIDILRQQLSQCWSIPAGARDIDKLVIEIELEINPDKSVRTKKINDTSRLSDPFYRNAAESALRAFDHPLCKTLKLPDGKYNEWKNLIFSFDPKRMVQ